MRYEHLGYYLPERTQEALDKWAQQGIPPGGFLRAVLEDSLSKAMGKADKENMANMPAICAYVYNRIPAACWGSEEKVMLWKGTMANANAVKGITS